MSAKRNVQTWLRERNQWWVRPPMPSANFQAVQVIGGQTVNGYPLIEYVADASFSLDKQYDPNVDTTYIAGLGYGKLYNLQGQPYTGNVLVRHNFQPQTDALMAGMSYRVLGTKTLTVPSGVDAGKTNIVYLIGFPSI